MRRTKSYGATVDVIFVPSRTSVPFSGDSTATPKDLITSLTVWTSANSGISVNVDLPTPNMDATIMGKTAFLAPLTRTVPLSGLPP